MLLKILQIAAVLLSSTSFAYNIEPVLNNDIINELVTNNNSCTIERSEDKIYLNPARIFPTEQGLYLNINNEDYVLLPTLNSDSQGCYISVNNLETNAMAQCGSRVTQPEKMWQCPYCHNWWVLGEECQKEECPTNQWKKKEQKEDREKEHKKDKKKGKK